MNRAEEVTSRRDQPTNQTQSLTRDCRARVPFAVIAVILLVATVGIIGALEMRGSGDTDTDVALAMDRADATIQTELREGVTDAATQAAREPLTVPANTSFGAALDDERPFESYLEALVYLAVADRFETASQQVGGVTVELSLPDIADNRSFESALDRVDIEPEREEGRQTGLLNVTLSDIQVAAMRDNETAVTETKAVTVSVPTPVLQQHERTEEFQERLDAGITESGFSQRFNARIYALGWARGYAQYAGMPVTEVIANRHIEPSANSAVYRTQQDVFGVADPALRNGVRRGWFCMATQDAEGLYDGYNPGEVDVADDVCSASEWILGDRHTGTLPDAPGTLDLLGEAPGMDESHTIGVNETAYLPLRTLVSGSGRHSIQRAIDRAFTIDTAINTTLAAETPTFEHEIPAAGANPTETEKHHQGVSVRHVGQIHEPSADEEYYRFENVRVAVAVTEEKTWEWRANGTSQTATTEVDAEIPVDLNVRLIEAETAPDMDIDRVNDVGIAYEYERGPGQPADSRTVPAPSGGFENYEDREADIAEQVVGGTDAAALEGWLAEQWQDVTHVDDLQLPDEERVGLDVHDEATLVTTIIEDLAAVQEEVSAVTHTFERSELVHTGDGSGPVGGLVEAVETERTGYLARSDDYENVGQKAAYEARYAYFEQLVADLERVDDAHDAVMGGLDDELEGVDSSLDDALSYLQQGTSTESAPRAPLESPPVVSDITYEVSGSPTYLAGEAVTTEEVPAVGQNESFSPFAMSNENHLKLPYESIISGALSRVLSVIGLGSADAELTFRAAGEALRAGKLSEAAIEGDDYATESELRLLNSELRDETDEALADFATRLGEDVVDDLYEWSPTPEYNGIQPEQVAVVESATETVLADYNSTAEAAIDVGAGEATDELVEEVTQALGDEDIDRPAYATNLSRADWREVVASAVHPAVTNASSTEAVTLSDTDSVERLDTLVRQALENVSADIVDDRVESAFADGTFDLSTYDDWVGGTDTPVRVPAGLPLLPLPSMWVATMNIWDIDADGEYARFEVTANMSAAGGPASTTYVRENQTVERDIAGSDRELGTVEPIGFEGRSVLVVVVPPGGIGVGDRDDTDPECSETYPVVGPFDPDAATCD